MEPYDAQVIITGEVKVNHPLLQQVQAGTSVFSQKLPSERKYIQSKSELHILLIVPQNEITVFEKAARLEFVCCHN